MFVSSIERVVMKITKDLGLFRQTEEYDYTPSLEEMYFYYRGTHTSYNRDNPYAPKYGLTVTKRRLIKVEPSNKGGKKP